MAAEGSARGGGHRKRGALTHVSSLGELLIPAINRVQDAFAAAGGLQFQLDLPQVAVVGSQSSGKSSVLESLVGRDFLPRGPDICTRRPLVLQLVHNASNLDEYGEFLHLPGERFSSFLDIRNEIEEETNRGAGVGKSISNVPIRLKIVSPHVLTMTLVDLPGITRVPVGNQPKDIEVRIREMIMEYIKHPSCIILAVSPANVDLANSDALNMAKQVDAEGMRTIGVLTKLDIMDRGTDAAAALRNEVVPLKLGYIGVVNRCQADINSGRSIDAAREAERRFFVQSEAYASIADSCGTVHLATRLNEILVRHIHRIMPRLKRQIDFAREEHYFELESLGEWTHADSRSAQGALLLKMLTEYAECFSNHLDGQDGLLPANEVAGGARIRHIFQNIFVKELQSVDPSYSLTDKEIQTAIVNCSGIKGSLLMPEVPFQLLVRRLIHKLLEPSLQCARFVCEEMVHSARRCESDALTMLPNLQASLHDAVRGFIEESLTPTEQMISNLVACELSHINTAHPDFIGGSQAIATVLEHKKGFSERQRQAIKDAEEERKQQDAKQSIITTPFRKANPAPPLPPAPHDPAGALSPSISDVLLEDEKANTKGTGEGGKQHHGGLGRGDHGRPINWLSSLFGGGGSKEAKSSIQLTQPPQVLEVSDARNDQEDVEVAVTRLLVSSYFCIVSKNLQDMIPKIVVHFMVNDVKNGLQKKLVQALYKEERFATLTKEHEEVAMRRERCQKGLKALHAAANTLDSVPSLIGRAAPTHAARLPKRNRSLKENSNLNIQKHMASPTPMAEKLRNGPLGRGLVGAITRSSK